MIESANKKIARLAECSEATVSRVLNNSAPVSPQTREMVLQAVREAGVVPRRRNRSAAGTSASKASGLVEVVMHLAHPIERIEVRNGEVGVGPIAPCPPERFFTPENRYSNCHFRRVLAGVIDGLTKWQMRPVVRTTDRLDDKQLLADINAPNVKGLILLGNETPEVEGFLHRCRCPIVSCVGARGEGWPPSVGDDDLPGLRQAIKHLKELGHTRIGYVAGGTHAAPTFSDRLTALRIVMMEAGLELPDKWVFNESIHVADIAAGTEKILVHADRPTAMLCSYDGAAIGVMKAATRAGLRVPEDLSIVGFGDQDITEVLRPMLTSVRIPAYEMGGAATQLLVMQQMQRDENHAETLCVRLPTSLVVRESTAVAPLV